MDVIPFPSFKTPAQNAVFEMKFLASPTWTDPIQDLESRVFQTALEAREFLNVIAETFESSKSIRYESDYVLLIEGAEPSHEIMMVVIVEMPV